MNTPFKKSLSPSSRGFSHGNIMKALDKLVEAIRKDKLQILVKDFQRSEESLICSLFMIPYEFFNLVIKFILVVS